MDSIKSIFIAPYIIITLYLLVSCSNTTIDKNKNNVNTNTDTLKVEQNIDDTITKTSVNKPDTIIQQLSSKIVDTFDTGEPLKIYYFPADDPENIRYEKQFYKNGNIFIEGERKNGNRTGKWIANYENGKLWSVGYYIDGKRDGSSNVYYENGQIRYTKNYKNDTAEGLWKFFDEDGKLLGKIMYNKGKITWREGVEPN